MNSEELERKLVEHIAQIRTRNPELVEQAKTAILGLAETVGVRTVHSLLDELKGKEQLRTQWQISTIMEVLIPPVEEVIEEEEDDPTQRPLRESELQMMAQVAQQGLVLFKSKVDTRWVLMQIDPYSGQLLGKQELDNEKGERIYAQMSTPGF